MAKKENKKKIKVLLVGFMTGSAMGENFVTVASGLSKHIDTYILTNSNIKPSQINQSQNFLAIPFLRYRILTFFNPVSYFRLLKYIVKNDVDCIYFLTPHPVNILISTIFFFIPQIYYLHDPFLHSGLRKFDSFFINLEYWLISKITRKIVVASKALQRKMIDKKWHNYPADQIKVIYLGLLNNLIFPRKKYKKEYDLLFFGRIEPYKGLDTLTRAMQILEKENINCCLAGRGDIDKIYPEIKHLPANIIRINKYVPDQKLAELIQKSKCIILPYRDATGTQTIPAAFYYGVPVITTNVGSLGEYVTDGYDGMVVPPEDPKKLSDAILALFSPAGLLDKLAENTGKSFYRKFGDTEILEGHLEVIGEITNYELRITNYE